MHNRGFAMNMLEERPELVRKVSFLTMVGGAFYQMFLLSKEERSLAKVGGALVLGGTLSNFYDRMMRGYVVDYLRIKSKWKKLSEIIFNIGDVCILLGTLCIIIFRKKIK